MDTRTVFHDSVKELPPQEGAVGRMVVNRSEPAHLDEKLTLHFGINPPKGSEEELERLIAEGKRVAPDDLDGKYGLTEKDTAELRAWLTKQHFTHIHESGDHTSVFATATAKQIAAALQVEFVRVTKDGITYTSARNAPSLPSDIAAKVHAIDGLQQHLHAKKHRVIRTPHSTVAVHAAASGARKVGTPPFLPSDLLTCFDGVQPGLTGKGQTIAILIDAEPNQKDLQTFWKTAHVEGASDRVVIVPLQQAGTHLPPPEGEESLDAEWTSGVAPGAAVRVYATGSLEFPQLTAGLQRILDDAKKDPTLRTVSISLGLGEQDTPQASVRSQHSIFVRLAALGVSVFVSSGDDGSSPNGTLEVEYPSSDPYVIAVGGTSLVLNTSAAIVSESAWSGSGGGKSVLYKRQSWQKGTGVIAGTTRVTPDVAAPADPNTGALVILNQQAQQIGGTSWSAPTWAGIAALVGEARGKAGKQPVFIAPLLYGAQGATNFRDVTTGSNGAYSASAGYDMVTGLGSPQIRALIAKLVEA